MGAQRTATARQLDDSHNLCADATTISSCNSTFSSTKWALGKSNSFFRKGQNRLFHFEISISSATTFEGSSVQFVFLSTVRSSKIVSLISQERRVHSSRPRGVRNPVCGSFSMRFDSSSTRCDVDFTSFARSLMLAFTLPTSLIYSLSASARLYPSCATAMMSPMPDISWIDR